MTLFVLARNFVISDQRDRQRVQIKPWVIMKKNACFRLLIWWTGPTNKSRFSFADFDKTWPV